MKLIASILFAAYVTLTFTGCKTVDGQSVADVERIARVAGEATTIAVEELLPRHPEWKEQFKIAYAELVALEKSDTIGINNLLEIINRLPIKELGSDEARIAVRGARLVISAIDLPEIEADRVATIRPIVTAIREALERSGVHL